MWLGKTFVWTYDDAGNITSCKEYAYTSNQNPVSGTPIKTNTYTYADSAWGDLLTAYNGVQWSYDGAGNLTNDGTWTYTWRNGRELASMSNGSTTWSYTYDANGMRTSRTNGSTTYTYVYNGTQLVQMTKGSDTLYFTYGALGPTTVTWNGTTYYYALNAQGDVIGIFDGGGNGVVLYNWDNAWGYHPQPEGPMADTLGTLNPLRYRSYVYDEETGLYYLQSRYYNPEIGRFINVDSVMAGVGGSIQGYNMFAYCFNNPVNMSDSSGHWPQWMKNAANWVNNNIIQPVVCVIKDVAEDIKNYDLNNQSEENVFKSNYFSNYKGALVVKTPFDASFSFGFIGLSTQQQNTNTLKHEYGHTVQMENMGVGSYIVDVAVPSVAINILDRQGKLPYDYYSYPWEAEANKLGESSLSQCWKASLPQGAYNSFWDLIPLFFE